jgi:AcrR family transcriptional regulator
VSTKRDETRARLLDAARRLLVARGYHGVTIDEIAREAGVSRQAVYAYHFGSKSEFLIALLVHVEAAEGIAELLRPSDEAASGVEALREAVNATAEFERRVHDVATMLLAARRSDDAAAATWADRMARKRAGIGRLVSRLAEEGDLQPGWATEDAADLAYALLSSQVFDVLVSERGWSVDDYAARIWRALASAIVAVPADPVSTTAGDTRDVDDRTL